MDQTARNVVGALGGAVLSACLLPQLYRLWRTRSARDLSYLYLIAYSTGLLLTFIYLYFEGATVAWICMLIEIACAVLVIASKVYLDRYYAHGRRKAHNDDEADDNDVDGVAATGIKHAAAAERSAAGQTQHAALGLTDVRSLDMTRLEPRPA